MGVFLVLLSMAAFVMAAVSFFRPFPRLGLTTKARSAMAMVGTIILFAIGGAMTPPLPEAAVDGSWPSGLPQLSQALIANFPPLKGQKDVVWSPVVQEKDRFY
ncbi:MAG: hypothetical protein Q8K93_07485, partial [Reyranella sp.]|nr:hypothetical protein [Reyranella sp.]